MHRVDHVSVCVDGARVVRMIASGKDQRERVLRVPQPAVVAAPTILGRRTDPADDGIVIVLSGERQLNSSRGLPREQARRDRAIAKNGDHRHARQQSRGDRVNPVARSASRLHANPDDGRGAWRLRRAHSPPVVHGARHLDHAADIGIHGAFAILDFLDQSDDQHRLADQRNFADEMTRDREFLGCLGVDYFDFIPRRAAENPFVVFHADDRRIEGERRAAELAEWRRNGRNRHSPSL